MNEQEQVEGDYMMENGYNYGGAGAGAASESFMGFFGGGVAAPAPYHQYSNMSTLLHHQESAEYWLMHMNSYKYGGGGVSGEESTSSNYYGVCDDDQNGQTMDFSSTQGWDHTTNNVNVQQDHHTPLHMSSIDNPAGSPDQEDDHVVLNSQVLLDDDDIDPDTMTYEELLDLGEAVGTQSRGLSQELINQLPTSKHKSGGIFSRRKSQDRCVICQMRYKRGDRQINLPCKHAYHTDCGSKWLSINKTCPVCNTEVFGDESSH